MIYVQVYYEDDLAWRDWDSADDVEEAVRIATALKLSRPLWTVRLVEEVFV